MSWNPNHGQDPNQPSQYGGYSPPPSQPQPTDPYSGPQAGQPGQQAGYGQQGGYGQQQSGQQYGGYQQPQGGYQQPGQQGPYGAPPSGTQSPLGPTSMGMEPNVELCIDLGDRPQFLLNGEAESFCALPRDAIDPLLWRLDGNQYYSHCHW